MVDVPPDDLDEGGPDEGRILAPEELDITESEHVEELDDGRFVVSPDGPPDVDSKQSPPSGSPPRTRDEAAVASGTPTETDDPYDQPQPAKSSTDNAGLRASRSSQAATERQRARQPPQQHSELSQEIVHRWLKQSFEATSSRYAFDVTATFDGNVSQRRMASNDVVTIFESLMLWYAQHVDSDTPVEDVLGILLAESNVPVRYPTEAIHRLVRSSNLTPEDSIADLLEEVDDGVQL